MLPRNAAIALTTRVLTRAAQLDRRRTPKLSPEGLEAWAETIARIPLPVEVWPEAVEVWALDMPDNGLLTPRDLRRAAFIVRDRWESRPNRRAVLVAWREERREERDRQLAAGTFAEMRGIPVRDYGPVRGIPAPPEVRERWL